MSRKALTLLFVIAACGSYVALMLANRSPAPTEADQDAASYANAISRLQLSVEQHERLASCCTRTITIQRPLKSELDRKVAVLRATLEQPKVNRAAVKRLVAEISDLRTRILWSRVEAIIEVHETFTADQMQTLAALLKGQE